MEVKPVVQNIIFSFITLVFLFGFFGSTIYHQYLYGEIKNELFRSINGKGLINVSGSVGTIGIIVIGIFIAGTVNHRLSKYLYAIASVCMIPTLFLPIYTISHTTQKSEDKFLKRFYGIYNTTELKGLLDFENFYFCHGTSYIEGSCSFDPDSALYCCDEYIDLYPKTYFTHSNKYFLIFYLTMLIGLIALIVAAFFFCNLKQKFGKEEL